MRNKSKFIGFILSFMPGLAHIYIGLRERGFMFLGMLGAGFLGSLFIGVMSHGELAVMAFIAGYSILWLICLVDLFASWGMVSRKYYENNNEETLYISEEEIKKGNRRTSAMAFSTIPGAGHMYLGYQEKGLIIMGGFFLSIFLMGWLGISLLLFVLPLIWFYSFFDVMHIVDGKYEEGVETGFTIPNIKPQWVGFGLIGIGLFIVLERILYPLIDNYRIRSYIQTSVVALVFIIIGIRILMANQVASQVDDYSEEVEGDEK